MKEDDAISRQAAKLKVARVIWEDGDSCYDFHDKCVDSLDDVPSVQPKIVRCKDCKHRDAKNGFCEGRGWPMQLVPDDGFCEKGERRD